MYFYVNLINKDMSQFLSYFFFFFISNSINIKNKKYDFLYYNFMYDRRIFLDSV